MPSECYLVEERSRDLVAWAQDVSAKESDPFIAARQLARRLGAHVEDENAVIGFWAPELVEKKIPDGRIFLEIMTATDWVDLRAEKQQVIFRRHLVPLLRDGEYLWGVVAGMRPGTRERVGSFYRVAYEGNDGRWRLINDPLAISVPFGAFAPAELYDWHALQAARSDTAYFSTLHTRPDPDGTGRITAPTNVLQIHVNTGSADGTMEGLTKIYRAIAEKVDKGEALTPAEQNYIAYDAVQLMPIEPTIEYESGPRFWTELGSPEGARSVAVQLQRPDMTNWGYDVVIAGSPAINPTALGSSRPDEFVDLIATLHNFPEGQIKVVLDVVFGHADNQALPLLNRHFFAGSNMYGQNLNYSHPTVRAILLEMQRRKGNFGIDGIRVDGAQDFKVWDPHAGQMRHDDDYLRHMNDIELEVAGRRFRPWMVFEDGRPWPQDDWELTSTYREVTRLMPNVVQWGPLTFAHNTPFLFTFWISKWWRIREIAAVGSHWITGCANHDTLRRGTQVDPTARINSRLGGTLPAIFRKAYNNPAAKLFDYGFMPGIPMDFINASMHAPWSFIRNTDDRYGVKVVSEEARFLDWAVSPSRYSASDAFQRLKGMGFADWDSLRRFVNALEKFVRVTEYDLGAIVELLGVSGAATPTHLSVGWLKEVARAWMDDIHNYCNVGAYQDNVSIGQAIFNRKVRDFRRQRPWLRFSLAEGDVFDHLRPVEGTVLFHGLRHGPAGEMVLFVANMEGAACEITPAALASSGLPHDGWQLALATPGLHVEGVTESLVLHDSEGLIFERDATRSQSAITPP